MLTVTKDNKMAERRPKGPGTTAKEIISYTVRTEAMETAQYGAYSGN